VIPEELRAAARRALALPDAALLAECEETFFVAGGPGGQHRNKTESGVRLVHPATGVTVTATERRSQLQNRGEALRRLRERLALLSRRERPRRPTRPTRGSKERRLAEKRRRGERKASRRDWD
jgi:ribosome-associated protein